MKNRRMSVVVGKSSPSRARREVMSFGDDRNPFTSLSLRKTASGTIKIAIVDEEESGSNSFVMNRWTMARKDAATERPAQESYARLADEARRLDHARREHLGLLRAAVADGDRRLADLAR